MTFGATIKELRKQHRMTQRELAERLRVNFTYISKIENDKLEVLPSEKLIRRAAEVLDADAEELLDLAGKWDTKRLQQLVKEVPQAGVLLRRMQSNQLTDENWKQIEDMFGEIGE